jgi:hypothetical protein
LPWRRWRANPNETDFMSARICPEIKAEKLCTAVFNEN